MSVLRHKAKRFLLDETGLELTEYALEAGFMAIAVATAFSELGVSLSKAITEFINSVEDGN